MKKKTGKIDTETYVESIDSIFVLESPTDKYCAAIAHFTENSDQYEKFLDMIEYFEKHKLFKIAHKAFRDIDYSEKVIAGFREISSAVLTTMIDDANAIEPSAISRAFSSKLYDIGLRSIELDSTLKMAISGTKISDFFNLEYDRDDMAKSLTYSKKKNLIVACKKLSLVLPNKVSRKMSDDVSCVNSMMEVARTFVLGKMDHRLSVENFSSPSEAGVFLPHNHEGRMWMVKQVSHIINTLYGKQAMPLIMVDNVTHVYSMFSDQEKHKCIYIDRNEDSPYGWRYTPSLSCSQLGEGGEWAWRAVEDRVKEKVNSQRRSDVLNNETNDYTQVRDQEIFEVMGELGIDKHAYSNGSKVHGMVKFSETVQEQVLKKHGFILFKLGPSTIEEIENNPQYLHILKSTTAQSVGADNGYLIQLVDLTRVLYIPISMWKMSRHVWRERKENQRLDYVTSYGMTYRNRKSAKKDALIISMLSLELTRVQMNNWNSKDSEQVTHASVVKRFIEAVSNTKDAKLIDFFEMDKTTRVKYITRLVFYLGLRTFKTSIDGITTKMGSSLKDQLQGIHESSQYNPELQYFDYDDDEGFGVDEEGYDLSLFPMPIVPTDESFEPSSEDEDLPIDESQEQSSDDEDLVTDESQEQSTDDEDPDSNSSYHETGDTTYDDPYDEFTTMSEVDDSDDDPSFSNVTPLDYQTMFGSDDDDVG